MLMHPTVVCHHRMCMYRYQRAVDTTFTGDLGNKFGFDKLATSVCSFVRLFVRLFVHPPPFLLSFFFQRTTHPPWYWRSFCTTR